MVGEYPAIAPGLLPVRLMGMGSPGGRGALMAMPIQAGGLSANQCRELADESDRCSSWHYGSIDCHGARRNCYPRTQLRTRPSNESPAHGGKQLWNCKLDVARR